MAASVSEQSTGRNFKMKALSNLKAGDMSIRNIGTHSVIYNLYNL
jgi:hypothetical protein